MPRFFIPDIEYLVDPEGLVGYVEKKVKLGKICLYCNGKGKAFHTYRALQQVRDVPLLASNIPFYIDFKIFNKKISLYFRQTPATFTLTQ